MAREEQEYTKYETARIIGARALQISMNAPILLAMKKEELEEMKQDSLKIAEKEFRAGVLPITVKRPFPKPKETPEEEEEQSTEETEALVEAEKEETEEGELEGKKEEKAEEKPAEQAPAVTKQ